MAQHRFTQKFAPPVRHRSDRLFTRAHLHQLARSHPCFLSSASSTAPTRTTSSRRRRHRPTMETSRSERVPTARGSTSRGRYTLNHSPTNFARASRCGPPENLPRSSPSRSMNAAAQVTTDDGDKVNHGWSQLDIAKHSTNTFVASLGDEDWVSVVTYWTARRCVRPPRPLLRAFSCARRVFYSAARCM